MFHVCLVNIVRGMWCPPSYDCELKMKTMIRTILENQRVILEALRDGTDTEWITSEIDKRIEATSEELSKFNQPTVIGCLHPFNDVVSGNDGDFCCKCQSYLKSNRL